MSSKCYNSLLLYIGFEGPTFHKIQEASGNFKGVLGWETNSLKGQDLDILLPETLKGKHKGLVRKDSYFGSRLETNSVLKGFVKTKANDIVEVEIYLKLAYFHNLGL